MRTQCALAVLAVSMGIGRAMADDPWADSVISFQAGVGPAPGYADPASVLGSPERVTGEGVFPGVVSPFNPAWGSNELVSLGGGGSITVRFDTPIVDDPRNPFGVDLIVFGNTGFIDAAWPGGVVGTGLFGDDGGIVEVSDDGATWLTIPLVEADGLYPSLGFLDAGPYDETPGSAASSFTRPVNPALTMANFSGLTTAQVVALYRGSGGGAGVDIGLLGLSQISYVRVSNPTEGDTNVEIEAFADVTPLGDLTEDHLVDVLDVLALLTAWGAAPEYGSLADLDGDGFVNVADLLIVLSNWG